MTGKPLTVDDLRPRDPNAKRAFTKDFASTKQQAEPPMTSYVTHAEFGAAMAKIDQRFDQTVTKADLAEVRAEIHKWMLATVLTIVGTMLAAIFGVAQVMKPGAPAIQQPPIIINVPGAAPAQAAPSPSK